MYTHVWLDTETYSETPIKWGTYRYTSSCEVMIVTWAVGDGPVRCWDRTADATPPADLVALRDDPNVIFTAQNAMFDRNVLRYTLGWDIPIERWRCNMVRALAHALPGGLENLCEVLHVDQDQAKIKDGKRLVQLFCKPRPKNSVLRRATRETHPEDWAAFLEYAKFDIVAMRALDTKLPKWNYDPYALPTDTHPGAEELRLWHLDQKINDRGFLIDRALAEGAVRAVDAEKKRLAKRTYVVTQGEVESTTKRDKLLAHILSEYGIELPDMQTSTLERRVNDPDLPPELRELLAIRMSASTTSTSKYQALLRGMMDDDYLRGTLQFNGASRTRRWAGRTFQPQNLPSRGLPKHWEIELAIQAFKGGYEDLIVRDIMACASGAIRGTIIAPPGKKIVVADLSNIEGRDTAYLAGEEWKLQAFRKFDTVLGCDGKWYSGEEYFDLARRNRAPALVLDGKGEPTRQGDDLYKLSYAQSFRVGVDEVDSHGRSIGKVCVGEGTLVLTDRGWIPIEGVQLQHRLWDGVEWVNHKGLLDQGVRRVVDVAGIKLTPEHLVLTRQTWLPAQQLASSENILSQALETGSENLPSWARTAVPLAVCRPSGCSAPAEPRPTGSCSTIFSRGRQLGARSAPPRRPTTSAGGSTLTRCRKTITGPGSVPAYAPPSTVATIRRTPAGTITAAGASSCATSGEATWPPFSSMLARCRGGITRAWKWTVGTTTEGTSPATSASSASRRTCATGEASRVSSPNSLGCEQKTQTYDLACAGPRTRFTVLTERGPLIVHNCELMLGYEGGVGAWVTGALGYGIDLEALGGIAFDTLPGDIVHEATRFLEWMQEEKRPTFGLSDKTFITLDGIKRLWRRAHPNISGMWKELKETAARAIRHPGNTFECRKFKIRRDGAWLRVVMPSGRALCYPSPKVTDSDLITYFGNNQYTRKWTRLGTYGGKLTENSAQSFAGDIMKHNMPAVEEQGYEVVLTVHDELVTYAPDTPDFNATHLAGWLARVPSWAPGLPLAAAGFETYRYRKD